MSYLAGERDGAVATVIPAPSEAPLFKNIEEYPDVRQGTRTRQDGW